MKRVNNKNLVLSYLEKYKLTKYFSEELINHMELFIFSKGELICSKDTELTHMFFLVEGKLKTYNFYDNGKSLLLKFNYPLSIFGDIEIFSNHKVQCNVEAMGEATLIAVEAQKVRKLAGNDPVFLKLILNYVCEKLFGLSNSASLNLLHSLETRLASYLLSMSNNQQVDSENNLVFKIPKLVEMSQLLGTSYRHLNRTMKDLINNEVIKKYRSTITIINLPKLKQLAHGNIYEN